ncbi:MAG: hypothetical protein QXI58_03210 [Candidatus Micrarchaeia archaeon]
MEEKKEERKEAEVPLVEGFRIDAKRVKEPEEVIKKLSSLGFLEIVETKNTIVIINVERRDIEKKPHLFSITYLAPDYIEFVYSYLPTTSPKLRRLEVIRYFLNLISILEGLYFIKHEQVYQIVDNFVSKLTESVSSKYDELFSRYDAIKEENERMKKSLSELKDANEKLRKALVEREEKINELLLRIKDLEVYSDEVLMLKIQDWLTEHGYEINISDFCKVNKVPPERVEQVLNKMIREGYITMR